MELRYIRFRIFQRLLHPFSQRVRSRRMNSFVRGLEVREGMTVLDLGGQTAIWSSVEPILALTILNLPGIVERSMPTHHRVEFVDGDACRAPEFADSSYDIVFSNSVIEHVGGAVQRAMFAAEVRRIGLAYWIQTPSKYFPIEAHCGMPLWWFYPARIKRFFLSRWRRKLPAWTEMVEGTDIVSLAELKRLFPDAQIMVERVLGMPKSYVAYRTARRSA
jgi:Methyltransferase domain